MVATLSGEWDVPCVPLIQAALPAKGDESHFGPSSVCLMMQKGVINR